MIIGHSKFKKSSDITSAFSRFSLVLINLYSEYVQDESVIKLQGKAFLVSI